MVGKGKSLSVSWRELFLKRARTSEPQPLFFPFHPTSYKARHRHFPSPRSVGEIVLRQRHLRLRTFFAFWRHAASSQQPRPSRKAPCFPTSTRSARSIISLSSRVICPRISVSIESYENGHRFSGTPCGTKRSRVCQKNRCSSTSRARGH